MGRHLRSFDPRVIVNLYTLMKMPSFRGTWSNGRSAPTIIAECTRLSYIPVGNDKRAGGKFSKSKNGRMKGGLKCLMMTRWSMHSRA